MVQPVSQYDDSNVVNVPAQKPDARELSFMEKVRFRMAHHMDSPRWVKYVDKVAFKDYARGKGVATPRTLRLFSDPSEIDPARLPVDCVIKANNGWARNIFIKGASILIVGASSDHPLVGQSTLSAWDSCLSILREWVSQPFDPNGQPQYKHIPPKILVEEFLEPIPRDLKFFVFDGVTKLIQVDQGRYGQHFRDLFDPDWRHLPVRYTYPNSPTPMRRPSNLVPLVQTAELLSDHLDFVRVDLFNLPGRILGSELTLTPDAGNRSGGRDFDPPEFGYELARSWRIPMP
jgi:hypothetical protein